MERTNQRGSVLGFVMIGAVLAVLLVGGVYLVSRYQSQPATNQDQELNSGPVRGEISPQTDKVPSQPQPDKTPVQPAAPAPENSDSSAAEQPTPPGAGETTPSEVETLPQTGPGETFIALVAAGLLAASTAAYMQSRRLNSRL